MSQTSSDRRVSYEGFPDIRKFRPTILNFLGSLSDMDTQRAQLVQPPIPKSTLDCNRRAPSVTVRTRETSGRLRVAI
jgi:hypothetical protein